MDFGGGDEIRFERRGLAGVVTLSRPKALNALTHGMVRALARALDAWAVDRDVALVVITGEGRAFCAGGDLRAVYQARQSGVSPIDFFADEYRLNVAISRFPKPYIALIDGIVMGGGVGLSFHGSHRVLTEKAVFAMPEVAIGFFPDVGGSHILSDLGGSFGMYLALTGNRIASGDALWAGLATHTMKSEYLDGLLDDLCVTGDIEASLREVFVPARRETERDALETIARAFSQPSLGGVLSVLEQEAGAGSAFAAATLATMKERSPTSLAVTFRAVAAGQTMSIEDCMRMEFRIVNRMLEGHELFEGVRAVLVDKDGAPRWKPATLAEVRPDDVDAYFAPLPGGELTL